MTNLYPPVLEAKAQAIPYLETPQATDFYSIIFKMPDINVLNDIGHIQIAIKYKENNESAVHPDYSPDGSVIYISREQGAAYFIRRDSGNYELKIPYFVFAGGRPARGTTYCVQVRFGSDELWTVGTGIDQRDFGGFAHWRGLQTSKVPSGFGEWSNVQTVYCYGPAATSLTVNFNDFIPELEYIYQPELDDPLEQVKIVYQYADIHGSTFKSLVFNGQYQQDGTYTLRAKIPLAPVQRIFVSLEAVTKNNTIRGRTINIYPLKYSKALPVIGGEMADAELVGEELYDGALAKDLWITGTPITGSTVSIYRCSVYTLETIKVVEGLPALTTDKITFKDYSPEMGEDYQYVAALKDPEGKVYGLVTDVYEWGYENPGYARLMKMESTFLTTKNHQLRFTGNVNVTGFKRVTSDQFQTTLGSKFPFYSRPAETNYRTFSLQGLVSIVFDPTASFLRNDYQNGLWWDDDNGSYLTILNRDLYGETQFSLSRRRLGEGVNDPSKSIEQLGTIKEEDVFNSAYSDETQRVVEDSYRNVMGPKTIYDEYLHRDIIRNATADKTNENIYLERKFREYVMLWLSDGKPKLFRSETEGNMIVMITNASFTPFDKSSRMVYSVSCTVTEIAEYSLENLLAYDLMPISIQTTLVTGLPRNLKLGDAIDRQDYLSLIGVDSSIASYFAVQGSDYILISHAKEVNEVINSITEYTFIRGDEDPYAFTGLVFQYNKKYNIPDSISGIEIKPIDLLPAVKGYTKVENLTFTVTQGQLPTGLKLTDKGIIKGAPIWENDAAPRDKDNIQITVRDNVSKEEAIMSISVGYVYSALKFDEITFAIPGGIVGQPITPIDIFRQGLLDTDPDRIRGGLKFTQAKDENGNPLGDTPYVFSAENLPRGISISDYGIISGAYTDNVLGTVAKITVMDAAGQAITREIQIGQGTYPIYFYHSTAFNIPYTEVGVEMKNPIDVSTGVSGGKPDFSNGYIHGYKFSSKNLPEGFTIDEKTGIITGTPIAEGAAQTATITATDFDTPESSASIEIMVQRRLPTFVFEDRERFNIDPLPGNAMLLGTVISPIKVNVEGEQLEDGTTVDKSNADVYGGLPYVNPPYYRFSSEKLIPDFMIDNNGRITGRAQVAAAERVGILKVFDARGEVRTVPIKIAEISTNLTFNASQEYRLPDTFVGANDPNYRLVIPFTDIQGGQGEYNVTFDRLPSGMIGRVHQDPNSLAKSIIIEHDPAIATWPTAPRAASNIKLYIQDESKPEAQNITVTIPTGSIIAKLTWTLQTTEVKELFEDGKSVTIDKIYLNQVEGGKYPYTVRVVSGDLSPFQIIQSEGGEQDANLMYITGKGDGIDRAPSQVLLEITDASGQTAQQYISRGGTTLELGLDFQNSFKNKELVIGYSVVPSTKIAIPSGGAGAPYKVFLVDGAGGQTNVVIPGLILDENGNISGRPTKEDTPADLSGNFRTTDSSFNAAVQNNRIGSWFGKGIPWESPKVVYPPKRLDGINAVNNYEALTMNTVYAFEFFTECKHSKVVYTMTGGPLPKGLAFDTKTGRISGRIEATSPPFSVTIIGKIPANADDFLATDVTETVTVNFGGVAGVLGYIALPASLSLGALQDGVAITPLEVSKGLSGGTAPYTWTLSGDQIGLKVEPDPNDSSKAYITGIPQGQRGEGKVQVNVSDASGQTRWIEVPYTGVYSKLTFNDSPQLDIPAQNANTDITPIDINALNLVSGGSGVYTFSADANLSPYSLTGGVISGNSGSASQPARTAEITVRDDKTKVTSKVIINIGAITGEVSFTGSVSIPAGAINSAVAAVNIRGNIIGGSQPTWEITAQPAKWEDNGGKLILDPTTAVITGTRPSKNTVAGVLSIMLKDAASPSTNVSVSIPVGAVTGDTISYDNDPTRAIPNLTRQQTGTLDISKGVINKIAPQYSIQSRPAGWNAQQLNINATTGVISYTAPNAAVAAGQCVVKIVDSGQTITATIAVGSVS